MKISRLNKKASVYRDRGKEENLTLFDKMRRGELKENEYCLRLRLDYANENPTLRDPVIYRIRNIVHPKTKRNHHVYPLYDFTHCLSDSIEKVHYSLCTLEFEIRRELYYIILHKL